MHVFTNPPVQIPARKTNYFIFNAQLFLPNQETFPRQEQVRIWSTPCICAYKINEGLEESRVLKMIINHLLAPAAYPLKFYENCSVSKFKFSPFWQGMRYFLLWEPAWVWLPFTSWAHNEAEWFRQMNHLSTMPKHCLIHGTPYEDGNICHFETTLNIFKEGRGYQIDAKAPGWGSFWCSVVSHSNSAHNTPCLLTCLWRVYGGTHGVTAAMGNAGGQMWGPGFLSCPSLLLYNIQKQKLHQG